MSKLITYKCDGENSNGDNCNRQTFNTRNWLSIDGEKIFIRNELPNRRLIEANRMDDGLHFCSKECLVNWLFKDSEDDS